MPPQKPQQLVVDELRRSERWVKPTKRAEREAALNVLWERRSKGRKPRQHENE